MPEQERPERGKFGFKSDSERAVRSIRATDKVWSAFGDKAEEQDMTRADYLEALFLGQIEWENDEVESDKNDLGFDIEEEVEVLKNAYTSKARGNKHLKEAIEEFLEAVGYPIEKE